MVRASSRAIVVPGREGAAFAITPLPLGGLVLIEIALHRDHRGFFAERYHRERFTTHGVPATFDQDNHSRSMPGVLRGLHYQSDPAQGKLVGIVHGRVWDVAVDVRPESPTFGHHLAIELSDLNGRLLWIPPGFAHGFCVLGDEPADLIYKVNAPYRPAGEGGIRWDDPDLGIDWPLPDPVVSARDGALGSLADYRTRPPVWRRATTGEAL